MVHKRCSIVIWGDLLKFSITQGEYLTIFTQIDRFHTETPVWIHRWLQNDAHYHQVP